MPDRLSIVIPSCTETAAQIAPLLYSIAAQCGVRFDEIEAILVRDGTEALDLSAFAALPYRLRQIVLPKNGGTGLARQAGIDAAQGEYILCCDADDTLQNVLALGTLMGAAKRENADLVISQWMEEGFDPATGAYSYAIKNDDTSWMHGKLLRRDFLTAHNIRFHPELRWNEETYFLQLCDSHAERIARVPAVTYVWKWGADSITRRNNSAYSFECMPSFIKASALSHREIEKFHPEHLHFKVTQSAIYVYFVVHQAQWLTAEHAEHREAAEAAFREWYGPTWKYFVENDPANVAKVYNDERSKNFVGGVETETLDMWLDRMGFPRNTGRANP